jgi:Zn-dependent protease
MFGNNFTLFQLFGFRVRANVSWLFLAILVTWSLASGFFPSVYPNLNVATYWSLGLAGMVGLFFSLLFHEFAHSLVARSRGLRMGGITLFLFGGVAEMEMEPPNAKTEFWMAIAGPVASIVLAAVFYVLAIVLNTVGIPAHIAGVARYLGLINLVLAAFNMVPGFPLDGGRILRAALWHWKGNLRWATRWASRAGQAFGIVLAALGILNAFGGNFVGGIWWFLIGLFLQGAATAAYQRLLQQEALKGQTVRQMMTANPTTVPADTSVADFVERYLYNYGHEFFPVTSDGRLVGCVTISQIKELPRDRWGMAKVGEIADGCSEENTIPVGLDAADALSMMQKSGRSRLLVTDGPRLVGVLVLKDLPRRLALRAQLEEG